MGRRDGWLVKSQGHGRVSVPCQEPCPQTAVPSPTCHFSPTKATMPGLSVTVINSSLMAKLSGPIPACLLSCKTFPWLAREKLGGKGKRLSFQNINLPLPLLPANLPANHLKERKPTLRTEPGVGAAHCSSACSQPLSFQQEGPGKMNSSSARALPHFTQRKKPGPAKGTILPPYLVTKISTRVYERDSRYLVSTFHVSDTPTLCLQSLSSGA